MSQETRKNTRVRVKYRNKSRTSGKTGAAVDNCTNRRRVRTQTSNTETLGVERQSNTTLLRKTTSINKVFGMIQSNTVGTVHTIFLKQFCTKIQYVCDIKNLIQVSKNKYLLKLFDSSSSCLRSSYESSQMDVDIFYIM